MTVLDVLAKAVAKNAAYSLSSVSRLLGLKKFFSAHNFVTNGAIYSTVYGMFFGYMVGSMWYASIGVLVYVIGEFPSYDKWVSQILYRLNTPPQKIADLDFQIIHRIANSVVKECKNYLGYARVALCIRSFYWWFPSLFIFTAAGYCSLLQLLCLTIFLSLSLPLSCEFASRITKHHRRKWMIQELTYFSSQLMAWGYLYLEREHQVGAWLLKSIKGGWACLVQ